MLRKPSGKINHNYKQLRAIYAHYKNRFPHDKIKHSDRYMMRTASAHELKSLRADKTFKKSSMNADRLARRILDRYHRYAFNRKVDKLRRRVK